MKDNILRISQYDRRTTMSYAYILQARINAVERMMPVMGKSKSKFDRKHNNLYKNSIFNYFKSVP